MKLFLHLSYKGTHYHGWQRQPGKPTVQETLEDALARILGRKVNCIGCGRTDAGVHASHYFCHIVLHEAPGFDLVFRLNKVLPGDISIHECLEAPREAHAQHDAVSRSYTYRIHTFKDAFLSELSAFYPADGLDVGKLHAAAALIPRYKDFRGVCMQSGLYKSTICQVSHAAWTIAENGRQLQFNITSDRFLKGMVRILVGNMLETAYGRMSLEHFEEILRTGRPAPFFNAAYPQGLYLSDVKYPFF
ncbi:MAG: tRNA pseudouridine synthase A [Saprospiraceae bacterium]